MSQVPLAPPPSTGGPLDSWLYLLWRRLTQAGQILWETITPGTSADVAAAVTDETGSPGSLVFSANPTLAGITDSGNLTFTGTGNRITGDFSNATLSNRVAFQSSTTNGNTGFNVVANGTGTVSSFNLFGGSDLTNYSLAQFACIGGSQVRFLSAQGGSGAYLPMTFSTGGAENARITEFGVVTLGGVNTAPAIKVTPVASQARWVEVTGATSSTDPTIGVSGGNLACSAVFMPVQATTAGAPTHVVGGMYFDTTLSKLRIGGAAGWETITSV